MFSIAINGRLWALDIINQRVTALSVQLKTRHLALVAIEYCWRLGDFFLSIKKKEVQLSHIHFPVEFVFTLCCLIIGRSNIENTH